jgi:hypothetical protein
MKYFLAFSVVLASSQGFAQGVKFEVDYSQCQQAIGHFGPQINHKGELEAAPGHQPNPDVKTVELASGEKEVTYTFKSQMLGLNGKPIESKYKVKKDKSGAVTEISTAQDKIDSQTISMYKQMSLNSAVYSGLSFDSLAYDPMVMVGDAPVGQQFNGKYVQLTKLSKEDAKKLGVDTDELRALKKQTKKDKKTLAKISDNYSKLLDKSHVMIPNGSEVKMEVKDGACKAKSINQVVYDAKSKTNHVSSSVNNVRCAEVLKVQKKFQKRLDACSNVQMEMYEEMNPQGAINGGYAGGIAGGAQGGYPGGGMMGGYPVGFAGGYGMGMGGYGMGYGFNSESAQCQMYFGEAQQGGWGGYGGGIVGGSSSGSKKESAKEQ